VTARREDGGSQIPETGTKELYISKKNSQNQNLSMKENQKHRHVGHGDLPLVGSESIKNLAQKGTTAQPLNPPRFQDHLVLETKPHFRIIIRLENALGDPPPCL
jgi:hypothetical protein